MSKIYRDIEEILEDWRADRELRDDAVNKYEADMASVSRRLELLEDAMSRGRAPRAVVEPIPDSGYMSKSVRVPVDKPTDPYAYPHVEEVHWSRPQVEALVSKMSELYCKYGNGMSVDQFTSVFEYLVIYSCAHDILDHGVDKFTSSSNDEGKRVHKFIVDNFIIPCQNACMDKGVSIGTRK